MLNGKLFRSGGIIGIFLATYLAFQHPILMAFAQMAFIGLGYILGKKRGLATALAHLLILDFGWFFSDWLFNGQLYAGLLGLFMLSLPAILFFWVGVLGVSFFTMPVEIRDWKKAARCFTGYISGFHYSYYVVVDGSLEERVRGRIMRKRQFPGIVLAEPHTAVPLSTGTGLSRVTGPGVTFIRRKERPLSKQAIDLRVQLRASDLRVTTRDGIEVGTTLLLAFSIEPQPPVSPPVMIRPYSEAAVFCAVLTERIGDDKKCSWDEVPVEIVKDAARRCIAKYRFDELLDREEDYSKEHLARRGSFEMPRERLRQEIEDHLKIELLDRNAPKRTQTELPIASTPYGIKVLGFNFVTIEPTGEHERYSIFEQRVNTWQTNWEAEFRRWRAQVEAIEDRELSRARTQAQMRMISALSEGFAQAKQAGITRPTEMVVLLRLLDAMDEMVQEPGTQELVPGEMQRVSAAIKLAATAGSA